MVQMVSVLPGGWKGALTRAGEPGGRSRKKVTVKTERQAKGSDFKILKCHAKEFGFYQGKNKKPTNDFRKENNIRQIFLKAHSFDSF